MACLFGENAIPLKRFYAVIDGPLIEVWLPLCGKHGAPACARVGWLQQSRRAVPSRENLVCRECDLETVLAPATALQFAVEAVKCWPVFITQSFHKLGRYSAGMCEVRISEGRGVGFYHV